MSFQSLRINSPIYILRKNPRITVEVGTIESVSAPTPKFQSIPQYGMNPEMVVDLSVSVNGQMQNFQKLPASADIADFGGFDNVVISTSREEMNNELANIRQKSVDVVNSVDMHKKNIEDCDEAFKMLNPEVAEKQKQQEEISALKSQMSELMRMNKELMAQIRCEKADSSKN